jgi:hypothetical protein
MITARVSHISAYARWKSEEDTDVDFLINQIISSQQTPAMAKGTAFHKVLEQAQEGGISQATHDGYTFAFTLNADLYLPKTREWRQEKDYGGIIVSGQCDAIEHKTIWDHKTTERFDAENYLESWQHKFYMDLFGADRFIWNVWEMSEISKPDFLEEESSPQFGDKCSQVSSHVYEVFALHQLTQYRYPDMEKDCRQLAQEYRDFAERFPALRTQNPPPGVQKPQQEAAKGPQWSLYAVNDPGGNLLAVGWQDGVLRCQWKNGQGQHHGVPENIFLTLRRVPFAYSYYTKTVKGKYRYESLGTTVKKELENSLAGLFDR